MSEENKQLIHRWFEEVWNEKRESAIDEMLDEETVHFGLSGVENIPIRGNEQYKGFYRAFINAFPDIKVKIEDCIAEGDKISIRCLVTGTNTGEGLGFAPTGRTVEFTGSGICTIKNGKFVEVWNEFDFLKMYSQLGISNLNL